MSGDLPVSGKDMGLLFEARWSILASEELQRGSEQGKPLPFHTLDRFLDEPSRPFFFFFLLAAYRCSVSVSSSVVLLSPAAGVWADAGRQRRP